jgi:hypothetical protein
MRARAILLASGASLALASGDAGSADAYGGQYRLVGPGPASVSAVAASPAYRVYVVGGAGQPVGISASTNNSVVTGGASNLLPTARIFRSGMEG